MQIGIRAPKGGARSLCAISALTLTALTSAPARAFYDCPVLMGSCAGHDQGGTTSVPAVQCPWGSRIGATMDILNGLPPGSAIHGECGMQGFFDVFVTGTPPTGTDETFQCALGLHFDGAGGMSSFHRIVTLPMQCSTHSNPRTPGTAVQDFDTEMMLMQGQLPSGDPDFDLLRITAGTGFGMPSPGHTTLTKLPNGDWAVDSFFDITYRIDFVGHPGGGLGGMSGSTTGTIRMSNGAHSYNETCIEPGMGTPLGPIPPIPAPCPVKPSVGGATMDIVDGLPPGSPIRCAAALDGTNIVSIVPGGSLGLVHTGTTNLVLQMQGTGALSAFSKFVVVPAVQLITEVGIPALTQVSNPLECNINQLFGQLPLGDRDFDLLRITAGSANSLPSPGHTTLMQVSGNTWAVDSFFDITYRIDFVGHSPGPLGGMSGSTTGTIRMAQGTTFPQLHQGFCGLDCVALGGATIDNEPDPLNPAERRLPVNNLGSSGQDGVSIDLRRPPAPQPNGTIGMDPAAQGMRCELDWGTGPLPPGEGARFSSFFDIFAGDLETARECRLTMLGQADGQTRLSITGVLFDVPAVQCLLRLHGQTVGSQTFTPPYPPGQIMALAGFATTPDPGQSLVVQHRLMRQAPGTGLPDTMEITVTNPFDAVCSFPNLPTVTADQVQFRVGLNGLPPGTRYIGNRSVDIHIVHPPGTPPGTWRLHKVHCIHRDLAARFRESPSRHYSSGVRVAAGDVNGDGVADLACTGYPPGDNNSLILLEADLDGDGEFEPLSSMMASALMGDGSVMPPNSAMRASFFDVFREAVEWIEARRCADGSCSSTAMLADFSGTGATLLRCRAYNGATLVADVPHIPMGQFATIGGSPLSGEMVIHGDVVTNGALRCDWSFGTSRRTTIGPGGAGAGVVCNRFVVDAEGPTISVEMLAMEFTGSNICSLAITNAQASSQAACDADVVPFGGNHVVDVNDLLKVITSWGACPVPCPPNCPADIVKDCAVNVNDLLSVITHWGPCPGVSP